MSAPDLSRTKWRKSSHSNASGGSCVDIAMLTDAPGEYDVAVRDSKDPQSPALSFSADQWRDFTAAIKTHDLEVI